MLDDRHKPYGFDDLDEEIHPFIILIGQTDFGSFPSTL